VFIQLNDRNDPGERLANTVCRVGSQVFRSASGDALHFFEARHRGRINIFCTKSSTTATRALFSRTNVTPVLVIRDETVTHAREVVCFRCRPCHMNL
jgi:hypothetical protein